MPRFDVNFADPKRYFYPGETVAGTVTIHVDEPMKTQMITLEFEGKSHVSWMTRKSNDMEFHSNSEEYFKRKDTLLGPASPPEEGIQLNVADYSYPFQYQLPSCLPPSFTAPMHTGYVLYCMYVTVEDVEHAGPPKRDSRIPFKVVTTPVDLNETRQLLEPKSETVEKFLCCLCCRSGPILLHAELQQQAFQPGETIVFSFGLDNTSTNKHLRKVEARLMQRVTFYSASRTETQEFTLTSEVLSEGIPPGSEGTWKDVRLNVSPDTVPSFECKCMLAEYYFVASVDIESAFDPKVLFPITIVNGVRTEQPDSPGITRSENGICSTTDFAYQPSEGITPSDCPLQPADTHSPTCQPLPPGSSVPEFQPQPANQLQPAYPPPPYSDLGLLPPSGSSVHTP